MELELEERLRCDRSFRELWDGNLERDEDPHAMSGTPQLEVRIYQFESGAIRIRQELSNERINVPFREGVRLEWLRENSEQIAPDTRVSLESRILESCGVVGGTLEVIWSYDLSPEQVRQINDLLGTSNFESLQSRLWHLLPDGEDVPEASQEFHRSLLSLGIIPTLLVDDDSFELRVRDLYGNDQFDVLTEDQLARLNGE